MKKVFRNQGFTIVELLIVIVVVGILSAIVIVSYQGVQKRAINVSRYDEVQKWRDVFMTYAATNGQYPDYPNRKFCLGDGFPAGTNGEPRCQNYKDPNLYTYPGNTGGVNVLASESSALNADLATITSNLPKNDRSVTGNIIGPWIMYSGKQTGGTIYQTFYNTQACPDTMQLDYSGTIINVCTYTLPPL